MSLHNGTSDFFMHDETLGTIFKPGGDRGFLLTVTEHVRGYVYEVRNLLELYDSWKDASQENPFYLGTFIFVPVQWKDDEGEQYGPDSRRFSVRRGQQRLISYGLLVACIRDYLAKAGEKFESGEKDAAAMIYPSQYDTLDIARISVRDKCANDILLNIQCGNTQEIPKAGSKAKSYQDLSPEARCIVRNWECLTKWIEADGPEIAKKMLSGRHNVHAQIAIPPNTSAARNMITDIGKGKNLEMVDEFKAFICIGGTPDEDDIEKALDIWRNYCTSSIKRSCVQTVCLLLAQKELGKKLMFGKEVQMLDDCLKSRSKQGEDGLAFLRSKVVPAANAWSAANTLWAEASSGSFVLLTEEATKKPSLHMLFAAMAQASRTRRMVIANPLLELLLLHGKAESDTEKKQVEAHIRELESVALWMLLTQSQIVGKEQKAREQRIFAALKGGCSSSELAAAFSLSQEEKEHCIKEFDERVFEDGEGPKICQVLLARINEHLGWERSKKCAKKSTRVVLVNLAEFGRLGNQALTDIDCDSESLDERKSFFRKSSYSLTKRVGQLETLDDDTTFDDHHAHSLKLAREIWKLEHSEPPTGTSSSSSAAATQLALLEPEVHGSACCATPASEQSVRMNTTLVGNVTEKEHFPIMYVELAAIFQPMRRSFVLETYENIRDYEWNETHAEALYDRLKSASKDQRFYLGGAIFVPMQWTGGEAERYGRDSQKYSIFDGQQRMVTIMIIFYCAMQYLHTAGEEFEEYKRIAEMAAAMIYPDALRMLSVRDKCANEVMINLQTPGNSERIPKVKPHTKAYKALSPSAKCIVKNLEHIRKLIEVDGPEVALKVLKNRHYVYLQIAKPPKVSIARNIVAGLSKGMSLQNVEEFKVSICLSWTHDEDDRDRALGLWQELCDLPCGQKTVKKVCLLLAQSELGERAVSTKEVQMVDDCLKSRRSKKGEDGLTFLRNRLVPGVKAWRAFQTKSVSLLAEEAKKKPSLHMLEEAMSKVSRTREFAIATPLLELLLLHHKAENDTEKQKIEAHILELESFALWIMLTNPGTGSQGELTEKETSIFAALKGGCNRSDLAAAISISSGEKELCKDELRTKHFEDAKLSAIAVVLLQRINEFEGWERPRSTRGVRAVRVLPKRGSRLGNLVLGEGFVGRDTIDDAGRASLRMSVYPLTRKVGEPNAWSISSYLAHHGHCINLASEVWNLHVIRDESREKERDRQQSNYLIELTAKVASDTAASPRPAMCKLRANSSHHQQFPSTTAAPYPYPQHNGYAAATSSGVPPQPGTAPRPCDTSHLLYSRFPNTSEIGAAHSCYRATGHTHCSTTHTSRPFSGDTLMVETGQAKTAVTSVGSTDGSSNLPRYEGLSNEANASGTAMASTAVTKKAHKNRIDELGPSVARRTRPQKQRKVWL